MKIFFSKAAFLIILLLSFACSAKISKGFYRGYETPEYEVAKKIENIEIRAYKKYIVAEVMVDGSRKEGAKKGFWILAKYIFGKNVVKEKIAMTSPVEQKYLTKENYQKNTDNKSEKIAMTSPVSQIPNQFNDKNLEQVQNWIVQFKMPKKYSLENLPQPINSSIKFKEIEAKKAVCITFAGLWSDEKFISNKEKLFEFAAKNNLKLIGEPVISYYDDPFTLPWNRRNEIIWEIQK